MKITLERLLLIIIAGLLIYSLFFKEDDSVQNLLEQRNAELVLQVDSIRTEIELVSLKLDSLGKDTIRIIESHTTHMEQFSDLIKEDSSSANMVIRYHLADKAGNMENYSKKPLTNEELANVGFRLIEADKDKQLLNNCKNREALYETELINMDEIIRIQKEQMKNLGLIAEENKPSWYEKPPVVAAITAIVIGGIVVLSK